MEWSRTATQLSWQVCWPPQRCGSNLASGSFSGMITTLLSRFQRLEVGSCSAWLPANDEQDDVHMWNDEHL